MKPTLRLLGLLLAGAAFGPPRLVQAQTPTLEFAPGAGNPTGNGPVNTDQVITFQNNTNNPTASTFAPYAPAVTATFSLSNQQFTGQSYTPGTGVSYGVIPGTGTATAAAPLFPAMNNIGLGGIATATANGYFTSTSGTTGGIDVTANNAVRLFLSTLPLAQPVPANQRYRYADLTITFNRTVVNPVIHLVGLGGSFTPAGGTANGFSTELDLLTTGVSLSKLSGSTELVVNAAGGVSNLGQINNGATAPNGTTGAGAASGSVLVSTPATGINTLTFRLYLRPLAAGGDLNGGTQTGDVWLIGTSLLTGAAVNGTVFEDVNYGGGAGRSLNASGGVPRSGARVELYNASGTFVQATTTDANGLYSFNGLTTAGSYTVRVVNNTVTSSRTGYAAGLLPVQTYNGTTTRVGGEAPAKVDAGNGAAGTTLASLNTATTIAESQATVNVSLSSVNTGPDFGYNFDTVVNTNIAGQGSLAQFITNANALGSENLLAQAGSNTAGTLPTGTETSIFMIPASGLTSSTVNGITSRVANINLTAALPTISGSNTSIDGTTQTFNIGNTNDRLLGTGGTVGTNGTPLGQLNGPEVQVMGTNTLNGITIATATNNTTVRGLSLYGFNTAILGGVNDTGTRIEQNIIGTSATSFTDPGAGNRNLNEGINLNDSDNGVVTNNLIAFNGGMGIWVQTNGNGSNNNSITGNEIRSNALVRSVGNGERLVFDGLELQGTSTGNTVSGNLITANVGHGIDSFGNGIGGNTITNNTISNNGVGVATNTGEEGSGLRVFGATNQTIIANNILTGNNGSGVLLMGTANQVTISQNVTSGNTRLGIDLLTTGETNLASTAAGTPFWNGNTGTTTNVTLNDNGDTATGGNGLLNFPVLTTANVSGTSLVINGYARPGSLVELFLATPLTTDPTNSNRNFGQGSSFLASRTEGLAADDSNTGAGTYSGLINGVDQGTDNTNQFTFTIPLANLTAAQRSALLSGNAVLTSTATLNRSTSEFSGNIALPITDVTTALTGPQTVSPGQPTGTYTATFTNEGPVTASTVTRTVTLPADATSIFVNGAAYTPNAATPNVIDFGTATTLASGVSNAFTFSFTPASTATGTVAITSNITTATSQGNNVAPDASTITAPVVPVANVAAALAATTPSVAAGALATAKYTATFSNAGPSAAAGVVASVQLPVGLTNVTFTNNPNGVYSPTTGILTFPDLTSLTATGSLSSIITFDAPASGPLVASATISTTTSEAGQTANNQAAATIAITPAFDLTTSLTGPASAVIGDLVTLNVTTTNNGPSAAANAVQTVQLVAGLTNVYVSNGGVYNSGNGAVTFPTLATLATGQTVANSISFSMPSAAIAPTALVTPNTASNSTTAGDTNTGNNTAATNVAVLAPATGTSNAYTTIRTSAATTTVGTPVTLTVTTGNNGPNQATGVTQTVQLLPGFTTGTLQVNGTTGTVNAGVITFGTNGPTYNTTTGVVTFPSLTNGANGSASGTSVTNTITLTPSAAANGNVATTGNNGQLLAMATVRTTNTDPVAADNVASVGITLAPSSDLVTTITGPATALAGQSVTYTASFTNNGPMAASGVTETAQLPAGLSAVTITDANNNVVSGTSYNSTTGLVTFPTLTTDANGATQVFKLTFAAPAQSFTPRSSVASNSSEINLTNNNASVATTVAASADLATLVSGPATAVVGTAVTYTVTTTNNGPLAAANASTTLQLATGFDVTTLRVNGTTGVLNGTSITYTFGAGATATTATYSTTSGVVTFPAIASLTSGTSVGNYVTFVMPNAPGGQTTGVASTTATGNADPIASNNSASVATSIAPTTTTSADLVATVSASAATVGAGGSVNYTATYSNIGTDPGVNVVPTLQLLPGLTLATLPLINGGTGTLTNGNITFSNGASYNPQSGVLTFPTIASQATGAAGTVSYNVQVTAPNNGPLLATAATTSNTSEPNTAAAQNNNVQSVPVNITPSFNEVTSISGPATAVAGTSQTYTVTTTNNGPSATSNATTQTVTVPAGQTPTNITNLGVYSSTTNTITWTIPAGQSAGVNGAVANSFTIVQPTTATTLTATVTVTGESLTNDNTATITTSPTNLAPLAYAVVNTLQNPQSNEAAGLATGLPISPLNASDPEGAFATQKYTIVAAPSTAQGTLYYLNGGTYTAVPLNPTTPLTLTDAQAQTLRFKAATGYVGNASFTYLTTDAAGNTSPVVNYTIPVETDVDAVAYTTTPPKGAANPYVAGDVIAYTTDANGAVYNAATASVYQQNGTLQPTVAGSAAPANGITAANEVAGTITGPNTTTATTLADIGLAVDATGRLVVAAAPNTSKLKAGSYSVQILTTDANGGQTSRAVSFIIPAFPLPVVLSAFTASAVANRDAQLTWTTASELNSAYFDVERSLDGTSFTKVGQLAAKGTTLSPTAYAFTDKGVASLATGTVYYRLHQVDRDGKAAYSPVRTVAFTKAALASLSLFPNPAQTTTKLDLTALPATGSYQVTLLDVTGRQVRTLTLGGGAVQPLELTTLASGTYYVLVTGTQADGSPLRQSLRLTKE
jgi:uncharacterized repeat protein (TIGR01451 family)